MKYQKKIKMTIIIIIILTILCGILLVFLNKKQTKMGDNTTEEGDEEFIEYVTEKLRDPVKFFSVEACIQNNVDENFKAEEINLLEGDRIFNYAVYGEGTYFIVRIDMENSTFLIEELGDTYQNINQINLETNLEEIKDNGRNTFEFIEMSDEDTCRMYFSHFSKMQLENPEKAYQLLEENYKKERFEDLDDYIKYIEERKQTIEEAVLAKYLVNYYDEYTEYVLVDNYDNSYTLKAKAMYDYTMTLDNYTTKVEDYEENYQKLSNERKVQSNVYIFLQMINTEDYKHVYELLDENFRNNNFATLEEFKEYVKKNFFFYNLNVGEVTISEEGNYYIYETTIKENSSSAAEAKKLTIIMKLEEGTDFVMSFSLE